jgi:formylglycine-generating enzyme required for sulfatase activity
VREYVAPQDILLRQLHEDLISHQDRVTIGHYLAVFGDPRRGVGLTADGVPDIDWVVIPAGNVKVAEFEKTFRFKKTFKVKSFRISRYLVTNTQFESFIHAKDGYPKPEWWQDFEVRPAPDRSSWLENNSPRTDVSWYEAVAFCRWLSEKYHERGLLGKSQAIRLPTEWEWQQAATGGDAKNVYPWGPEWGAARCNSIESELNRTTAVGLYPNGATRQGVLDMAGNVWEWCQEHDLRDEPSATEIDNSGGQRVVRGGSWDDEPGLLRASVRYRYNAVNRGDTIGFRLAQDLP